jgi:hypothetical protein
MEKTGRKKGIGISRKIEGSKEAEYYLVGSMLSFSAAIIVGLVVKQLIIN